MIIRYDYEKLICDMEQFKKDGKLTIRAFAKNSGINVAIVSRILSRDYRPGAKMVERLANAMGKTALEYSIEPVIVSDVYAMKYGKMTVEQIDKHIAKLVEMRNAMIQSEIEKLESQKEEITKSITEYQSKLLNKDELLT